MVAILFGTLLPWLLIAVGTWLAYQLVRQNGRILLRLESIDERLRRRGSPKKPKQASGPAGLPVGSVAPEFDLPDFSGVRHKLADFRGKNVLLMYFNPKCGFCTQMMPELMALSVRHEDGDDHAPTPVIITTGDVQENRRLFEQHGVRCTLLIQNQMDVATQYRVHGTPIGYLIDGNGRIASEQAAGAVALLQLAHDDGACSHDHVEGAHANGSAAHGKQADPSLAKSRINRSGLVAGTVAPDFRLPRLDGGELSLATFRGNRVLLVFSDPDCGPCDELAPLLQQLHLDRSDLQILVVSRRDVAANRAKAAKLGLTFPIVLQKQWELSLKYAMFATPIGYLIDEDGIVASNVAIGVKPILGLATHSPLPFSGNGARRTRMESAMAN